MVEGRRLAKEAPFDRWAFGDLALRAVPPAGRSRDETSAAQRDLARFAADIGVTLSFLKDCYYTSRAWPPGRRFPDISHAKHSRYRARQNRVDLLLNEEMADGLPSARIRDKVERAEELLADKKVRDAIVERADARGRRIARAARAIDNEELIKARTAARIQEQQLRAQLLEPEYRSRQAERVLRANTALARMITELLDFQLIIHEVPAQYRDRTLENLDQVHAAADQLVDVLRPGDRSTQPCTVIDMTLDGSSGGEHRSSAGLPRAQGAEEP